MLKYSTSKPRTFLLIEDNAARLKVWNVWRNKSISIVYTYKDKEKKTQYQMHVCSKFLPLALQLYVWSSRDKNRAAVKTVALTVTQFSILNRSPLVILYICFFYCFEFPLLLFAFCWYFIFRQIIPKAVPIKKKTQCKKITFRHCFYSEEKKKEKWKGSNMIIFCWFDEKRKWLHFHCGNESIDFGIWYNVFVVIAKEEDVLSLCLNPEWQNWSTNAPSSTANVYKPQDLQE